MELTTAVKLIKDGIDSQSAAQTWADLGAGDGLFTKALATLLHQNSTVFAIDKDAASLKQIPDKLNTVSIQKVVRDFSKEEIPGGPFDGMLMANSLHFMKNQRQLLVQLSSKLRLNGRLILVEYDMDKANTWVPYPISYNVMTNLAKLGGFGSIKRLAETPSVYNKATIYSVQLIRG